MITNLRHSRIAPLVALLVVLLAAGAILLWLATSSLQPQANTGHPDLSEERPESFEEEATFTFIAESISDIETGQPVKADIYLNGALLYEGVTHFQMSLPLDGPHRIRVIAPGYRPQTITPDVAGENGPYDENIVVSQPVRMMLER